MSPGPFKAAPSASAHAFTTVARLWFDLGRRIREERVDKRWSVRGLAARAGVSVSVVYLVERGEPASTAAAVRLANALGLRLAFELTDPKKRSEPPRRLADPVHSNMGELEASHLRGVGFPVGLDEPYQHYQFAGRADVVSWDIDQRALLHLENRTRFPDFQEMAGAYNAKRAYLAASMGERLGVRRWASETHVIVGLWSSEVLHALRLRSESFRALCPHPPEPFRAWWEGRPPPAGKTSTLIILDPLARPRQRTFISLDEALTARPRHRGYADAAARLGG